MTTNTKKTRIRNIDKNGYFFKSIAFLLGGNFSDRQASKQPYLAIIFFSMANCQLLEKTIYFLYSVVDREGDSVGYSQEH